MFVQERKQLEFGRNSGWYRHRKKADPGKRKGWRVEKEQHLPAVETLRGYSRCLILATFPSVALRSASRCSDQLRLLLITFCEAASWRLVPLLSQPGIPEVQPNKATRQTESGNRGCNPKGRDAVSDSRNWD